MAFIWSPESLEALFENPSEDVRNWAVSKFLDLYPDMFERVIGLLPTAPEGTASRILHHLIDLNVHIPKSDPFVEILKGSARWDIKALSAALLLRSGYSLLHSEKESIGLSETAFAIASTEHGFDILLELYKETSQNPKPILHGIAEACGFTHLFNNLLQAKGKEEIRTAREYFSKLWGCNIPAFEGISDPQEILSSMELTHVTGGLGNRTLWKRGFLAELEYDTERLARVQEIAKERAPKWSDEETRFMMACILCLKRNDTCCKRLTNAEDASGLWRALVMKPWRGVPGQALLDYLFSLKPDDLLNALPHALDEECSYASYAFSLLNTLDTPGRFELFLNVFEGKRYADIHAEKAGEALRKAGSPAIEFIMEQYPQMSQDLRTLVLFVLDSFPTPEVVDFCLKHFDEYMCASATEEFVGCLEEIASSRFLSPLLQEWREGEVVIGEAIKLISEINSIRDAQIDNIIQDTEKRTKYPDEIISKPISSFPLRCTKCGRTYEYELENIYVCEHGSPVIGDIIQCKGCGSIETYEMTDPSQMRITAEMLRVVAFQQRQEKGEVSGQLDSPIKPLKRLDLTTLGRKVKSTGEAYHLLEAEIEKHPQNADIQKRMGNLLKNGGKPDLAFPYYLEAIRINPDDVESHYSIVDMLIDQKRYGEAIPYLERLVPLCRECKMAERRRRNMFSALLDQVQIIRQETGHNVELFPLAKTENLAVTNNSITLDLRSFEPTDPEDFEWLYNAFRYGQMPENRLKSEVPIEATPLGGKTLQLPVAKVEKVGRNDPCPCGSGKKYKKCCGR
jgi:tetratricopeptide (TPR) repeat protein